MDRLQCDSLVRRKRRWHDSRMNFQWHILTKSHDAFGIRINELQFPQLLDHTVGTLGQVFELILRQWFVGQNQLLQGLTLLDWQCLNRNIVACFHGRF